MNIPKDFINIFNDWEKKRFPHSKIKKIANEYSEFSDIEDFLYQKIIEDYDTYLDFCGTFFWEYWKFNKPKDKTISYLLIICCSNKISDITRYGVILSLTTSYKYHIKYSDLIFKKLNQILKKSNIKISESILEQINSALY